MFLLSRNILPINPSFRIIALAEPPVVGSSKQQWMSPEMLTMFLYHHMRPLSRREEFNVISSLVRIAHPVPALLCVLSLTFRRVQCHLYLVSVTHHFSVLACSLSYISKSLVSSLVWYRIIFLYYFVFSLLHFEEFNVISKVLNFL